MKYKWIATIAILSILLIVAGMFSGLFGQNFSFNILNAKPTVAISYPLEGATVFGLVMISGTASDADKNDNFNVSVEVRINDGEWAAVQGGNLWSYDWTTYSLTNGQYTISARSYDGKDYSIFRTITVTVSNPTSVASGSHKWAVFIAAANFPKDNASKLGNGGLNLAEKMAAYFIEQYHFPTSNIIILFDDGWIRADNGYGAKEQTLQQRQHEYDITYGGATRAIVASSLQYIINQSNQYQDSEVFLWIFNHGTGDSKKTLFGGKILQSSEIFLWDTTMTEKDLGTLLRPLQSTKTTVLVDACYAGGFADKTIFDFRSFFLLRSGIPQNGRVVVSGTSKFRPGYASTTQGPIFSILWFEGLSSGKADGFRSGLLDRGVERNLRLFKDGKVSVEEAFYYARYILRTDSAYKEFKSMQPQINDQYPHKGLLRNNGGLTLE